jgi:predicted nucleic-acid-binding protein
VLAIDTNVIVRLVVDDDHEQFLRANRLISNHPVFVSITVLLECEWVLRSAYGLGVSDFVDTFRDFAGLANVTLEDPKLAATALNWHEKGMDFADAMHLGRAEGLEAFVSFDKWLAKAAGKASAIEVRAP